MSEHTDAGGTTSLIVFDVNETLSDMSPMGQRFEDVGLAAHEAQTWFAGLLRDGFALTSVGENPAFAELGSESLRVRLHGRVDDVEAAVERVMSTFGELTVHPDVVEGIHALRSAGLRLVTLSNGSTAVAEGLLGRAGILEEFETLLSVTEAPAWKPVESAYAYALSKTGTPAGEAMLVAVHPWDIDGAARAGLRTGWLNRVGGRYPAYFASPSVTAADLVDLAARLT